MKTELLHKYFRGETTEKEENQIVEWVESSVENKEHFLKERMLFDVTLFSDGSNIQRKPKGHLYLYPLIAIAAMLAIVFVMDLPHMHKPKQQLSQTIRIPAGQRAQMDLPDGSVVWLNSQTTLTYDEDFGKKDRKVTLDGEAYFDVAKDKKRPFIVETGKCNMEVLGTKFNVEGYSDKDDFEVTLMEGSVRVASRIGLGDTLMLKPDSKACLQKDGRLKVIPVDDYNPYRWKEGLICFRNESFLSIMSDLEKYFGVSIVVENKNVLKYYFTGKFRQADGIDYALRVLQRDIRFKYERDDENQIIYIR